MLYYKVIYKPIIIIEIFNFKYEYSAKMSLDYWLKGTKWRIFSQTRFSLSVIYAKLG